MTKKHVVSASGRGRKPLPLEERKARVIQTRVPDELEATLRDQARKKRVTVSQLIRNVLEDTFELVDDVVAEARSVGELVKRDAQRIARSAQGRRRAAEPTVLDAVDAWQEVIVNRAAPCARCRRTLERGERAMFGLSTDSRAPRLWLCAICAARI